MHVFDVKLFLLFPPPDTTSTWGNKPKTCVCLLFTHECLHVEHTSACNSTLLTNFHFYSSWKEGKQEVRTMYTDSSIMRGKKCENCKYLVQTIVANQKKRRIKNLMTNQIFQKHLKLIHNFCNLMSDYQMYYVTHDELLETKLRVNPNDQDNVTQVSN